MSGGDLWENLRKDEVYVSLSHIVTSFISLHFFSFLNIFFVLVLSLYLHSSNNFAYYLILYIYIYPSIPLLFFQFLFRAVLNIFLFIKFSIFKFGLLILPTFNFVTKISRVDHNIPQLPFGFNQRSKQYNKPIDITYLSIPNIIILDFLLLFQKLKKWLMQPTKTLIFISQKLLIN